MTFLKFSVILFVFFIIFTLPSISQDDDDGPIESSNPNLGISSSQPSANPSGGAVSSFPPNNPGNSDKSGSTSYGVSSSGHSSEYSSSNSVVLFKDEFYIKPLEYPKKAVSDRSDNLRKIYVEIISNNEKNAELDIREYIDKNLSVFLPALHGYVLTTPDEYSLYKLGILEELESKEDVQIEYYNNRVCFNLNDSINYSINESNKYEVNSLPTTRPYSRNADAILYWNNSLNNTCISNCSGFSCFLQSDLLINNSQNSSGMIYCDNDRIEIPINGYKVFLNKSRSKMDDNSTILRYGDIITHLRYDTINEKNNLSTTCIYNINDIIAFDNVTIPPGSLFVYWYYVVPKSYGTFRTETVSFANISGLRELSQNEMYIENQPVFKVTPKISASSAYVNETLSLEYNIEYMGGGSQSSSGNVSIIFDTDPNYYFVDKNGHPTDAKDVMNFKKDSSVPVNKFVRYTQKGVRSLPGIRINKKHYPFDGEITIDDYIGRYPVIFGSLLAGLIALLIFILTLIFKDIILCDERDKQKLRDSLKESWRLWKPFAVITIIGFISIILTFIIFAQ